MTKFEAFEILFKKLSVWKMVEIYNNHFPGNNIYALTTQNINMIFANHTPYYLLQQFSSNIDIHDNWIAKDPWSLEDVWYSYSDEEIADYIEDEIVTLHQDSNAGSI